MFFELEDSCLKIIHSLSKHFIERFCAMVWGSRCGEDTFPGHKKLTNQYGAEMCGQMYVPVMAVA